MARTNNIPLNPATPPPGMIHELPLANDLSFAAAQAAAREWADKALVLGQAGDSDQARYARFRAEAWLVKMLTLEAQLGKLENGNLSTAGRPRRAQRRPPFRERREATLNNAALSAWPRSLLREQAG